ncbi:DsbA family protein [Nocardia sp. NBC_00565]|uniref:DsbA family protein n=1 Tax=Nocardia sp. NBC_00565 TaxID=2975993 RepID=UPI002E804B47|nr:thioredoxin domain-containing protein [Nocardia sp. NBC_00565]WUC03851.1 DsbA family protein [Nocardia sp. NBC_00565]
MAVVAALLFAVVGVVGVVVVQKSRTNVISGVATAVTASSGTTPAGVTAAGAVRVGDSNAKVVVRVVADLQCPACKQFEKRNAKVLEDAAGNGTAIEYDVISFLDRTSSTQYSSRAANASYCVAGQDHSKYQGWFAAMFEQQPAEGGSGLPDSKLIEIAKSAGYTDPSVAQCITDRKYDTYLRDKTEQVLSGDVNATPTVFVNGKKLDSSQLSNGLGAAIAAAR